MTQTAGTKRSVRLLGSTIGAAILCMGLAAEASAQGVTDTNPASAQSSIRRRAEAANARPEKQDRAPEMLPGAKARAPVAPAIKSPNDMSPNEAMFDAINRGDMATVKDALSRGADLSAHNVLGMTPLDLSVDLGRNDISFLLLSMRGEGGGAARAQAAKAQGMTAQKPGSGAFKTAETGRQRNGARTSAQTAAVAGRPVAAPKLFARDGGTPVPNAGFLGFDAHGGTN